MRKKWLDFLVDPVTRSPLKLLNAALEDEIIREGTLQAEHGRRIYPIIRGVPRFVEPELYEENPHIDSDLIQTGRSFGEEWLAERNRSLGQTQAEQGMMAEKFMAMLGVETAQELAALFRDGMNCLNAGCGVAWSEYIFNLNPRVNRFAIDLSLAVERAYENTVSMNNVCVAQADIFALPFRERFFDIIFSFGVLHHTPDARQAFAHLCRLLKPGGLIGIYVYCLKPFVRELTDREIRKTTTEMTFRQCYDFCLPLTLLGKALQQYRQPLIVEMDIPLLGIKKGKYDLQKFVYDHLLKCFYNEHLGQEFSILANVDWFHPKYASHHSRDEVSAWFAENRIVGMQFKDIKGWEHSGFFVSGRKQV